MTKKLNRRQFGQFAGAAAILAATGTTAQAADPVRLIWWGNPDRDKRTDAVVDLYKKTNGVDVTPEHYAWDDYWAKLATQAAGKNLPDLIQMDYRYIFEYARRNQLAVLDGFIGKELQLANFDPIQLDSGKVDNKIYGVSLGANSTSNVYNKGVLDSIGVTLPDTSKWTTVEWVALGKSVKAKLPAGMYFSENQCAQESRLQVWLRSRGKDLYTADGKVAYGLDDLVSYFAFWKMMQDEGLAPPADVQAQDSNKLQETMIVTKKSVFNFLNSNQLVAMQKLIDSELDLAMVPLNGPKAGQYFKPSMFMSIAETSADKSAAAKLMNYFVTDPAANDILLIERGVTGDNAVRKSVLAKLNPTEQKIINYLGVVGTRVSALPPPPPKNAGELDKALRPAWESVAFGRAKLEDAAKAYYDNAVAVLARA